MKQIIPLWGYNEVTLPGTPEYRNEQDYGRDDIAIGLEDIERLEAGEHEYGIAPP